MQELANKTNEKPMKFIDYEKKWAAQKKKTSYELKLAEGFMIADRFLTQSYLDIFSAGTIYDIGEDIKNPLKLRIFEISKIVYDPNEQINDKFISVYSSLHNLNSAVAIIIKSNEKEISFFAATRSENNSELAGETLRASLKGNFPGIEISESISGNEKRELLDTLCNKSYTPKSLATVSLIPSERDEDKDKFIQGMEKFLGSMNGKKFSVILLATPVDNETLKTRKLGFEGLYSHLSPHSRISISFAHSETDSVNEGISSSFSSSINNSVSNTNGTSSSESYGTNIGTSDSFGYSGENWSANSGFSSGSFSSYTSGTNFSNTVSNSTGKTNTEGTSKGVSNSIGDTDTTSLNFDNKSVQNLLEKAENQLKRIDFSEAYGMWDFCAYFFSDDIAVTTQAANMYKALMMGNESSVERAHINIWNMSCKAAINKIVNSIKYLKHPIAEIPSFEQFDAQRVTPTNMVNGKELPIVLGFPRKSVPGMAVVEMAEFGRAVIYESQSRAKRFMEFGNIYHMGIKENLRVPMDMDLLSSHCFITGSSGSGKSYATYQLLDNILKQGVHMMVIEPAKGEYKQVFGGLKGIRIFNTDPNVYKLLRINPFQFPENLHVLTHIEKLIQIFNASWSLTAAMPALLKEAVVKSYVNCGWDIMNSIWIEGISEHKYPVFKDVLEVLPILINESDYSADSKGDYKGALLTRVQSMTSGLTGLIFERSEGISDSMLFDSNTIVDLSDIGSEETIALIMGVLIMRLGEYRQAERKAGRSKGRDNLLNHVTVLEEAHNLLKRTSKDQSQESSNIVGKSVEMISNSIKEMRTYGEGFIIIDQSPMAVDTSAIENTSTKIIMNTPAKDACEELSSTLSLNDEQSKELSRLTTGVAAVFQKGWLTPVLMKIDMWDNKYETEVKKADLTEMCILRGKLIVELINQSKNNEYSTFKLTKIINASQIDEDKKKDFNEIVYKISHIQRKNSRGLNEVERGGIYLQILNCDSLFDVIEDKYIYTLQEIEDKCKSNKDWFDTKEQKTLKKRCVLWKERFKKALVNYAYIEEPTAARTVLKAIITNKCDYEGYMTSRYSAILYFMNNKEL